MKSAAAEYGFLEPHNEADAEEVCVLPRVVRGGPWYPAEGAGRRGGRKGARSGLVAVVVETMAAGGGGEAGCDIRRLADVSIAFEARTSRGGDLLLVATKSAL